MSTRPCKDQTLLVSVILDAQSAMADKLAFAVSVGGGLPTTSSLDHTPGQSSGSVEIDFPTGYPRGQMVTVAVTATQTGSPIGSGSATKMLSAGCESVSISVTGGASGMGGSGMGGGSGTGGSAGGTDAGAGGGAGAGAGGRDGGVDADGGGCSVGQSMCGGVCASIGTDRAHCGSACAVCGAAEVCQNICMAAVAPAFTKVPADPAGWLDPAGAALSIGVRSTGYSNAIYECRTGPDATFTTTVPAWAPCDGATGGGFTHTPSPTAGTPEGNYRTEHRYRADTYVSPVIATRYYVHHALDKVLTCPRAGQAADGPHFTDADYFTAAQAYATANPTLFPLSALFPAPSAIPARGDAIYLRNPFIKIPFVGVLEPMGLYASIPNTSTAAWPAAGANYLFNERSLRHAWIMNPGRTMILMKRRYASPVTLVSPTSNCLQQVRDGHNFGGGDFLYHFMTCEALVLNTHGSGICLNINGTALIPVPVEAPAIGVGTVTATLNGTTVTGVGTNFVGTANRFIQIPAAGGRWYRITAVATATSITITPAYAGATAAGLAQRVASTNTVVIPAAYAKMHTDAHNYATGATSPFTPSPKTKCEIPGCNTNRPWLTYLPP